MLLEVKLTFAGVNIITWDKVIFHWNVSEIIMSVNGNI